MANNGEIEIKDGNGNIIAFFKPERVVDDNTEVSLISLRIALKRRGLYDSVNAAIMNGSDEEVKMVWEYGNFIRRGSQQVIALGSVFNLTEQDLDDIWVEAINIMNNGI